MNTFKELFKEYFEIGLGLNPREKAKYYLIERYKSKVSKRLLDEQVLLRQWAKENFKHIMADMMSRKSLLDEIKKDSVWQGSTLVVPFAF
jgi:hypothetical protein